MADLETVSEAAASGLTATAPRGSSVQVEEPCHTCADCGAETIGRFCHQCGNPSHIHRTLGHLLEEFLHGIAHFDGRAWRTFPLLVFRPGRLTREWCVGKRARYVPPLALFLFTVFVLFMGLSYLPEAPASTAAQERAAAAADLARDRAALAEAEAAFAQAATPEARAELQAEVENARVAVAETLEDFRGLQRLEAAAGRDWKGQVERANRAGKLKIDTGDAKLDAKLRHKLENPELALYKLHQTFYKFSFLLVPISIPFVAVLFLWKREFTLYDHGVFVLYSLTFMSVLVMVLLGVMRFGGVVSSAALAAVPVIAPTHMFFQLKGAYGLSAFSALWRTGVLLAFSAVALGVFLLAILWLGLG